jgi:hypothetical protein
MKIWNTSSLVSLRDGSGSSRSACPAFRGCLVVLAGQLQAQPVVLDALAPQVLDLGVAFGPVGLFAVVLVALVGREIKFGLQQFARIAMRSVKRCWYRL